MVVKNNGFFGNPQKSTYMLVDRRVSDWFYVSVGLVITVAMFVGSLNVSK
jgi:hypothetical protein